jgi:hypothetical protein
MRRVPPIPTKNQILATELRLHADRQRYLAERMLVIASIIEKDFKPYPLYKGKVAAKKTR